MIQVDATARTGDDTYRPSRQEPDRGLADEEAEDEGAESNGETRPGARVNFFA